MIPPLPAGAGYEEPDNTGWSFYTDNDALAVNRDEQYTGGFALSLSGKRAQEYPISLDPVLQWLDRVSGFAGLYGQGPRRQMHSIEFGLVAFNPKDAADPEPIFDDRPYAGLVFMSNTQQTVQLDTGVTWQSSFVLGLLGSNLPKAVQDAIHDAVGSDRERGWDNQISDGGELTAQYVVMRQRNLLSRYESEERDFDLKYGVGATLGFVTQVGVGLTGRWGRIRSPWWSFNPHYAEYINLGAPNSDFRPRRGPTDFFVWAGTNLRYRIYNALLQGQFRDSAVTFDRGDLNELLLEADVGVTRQFANGVSVSFTLRVRSPEIKDSVGDRPLWGGVIISREY